jgi:purine-binding chemotaxis protein CheW
MARHVQYCTFFVDSHMFGIDVLEVQEIIRAQRLTRVPLAPPVVEGLMNLRGQIVTAIDLRRRLEFQARPATSHPVNVVVRADDEAYSLLVDEIGDVVEVAQDSFEDPPDTLTGTARKLITRVCKLPGHLLLILNTEETVRIGSNRN